MEDTMELKDISKMFAFMVIFIHIPRILLPQVNLLSNSGMENWDGGTPSDWDRSGSSYIDEENDLIRNGRASARFRIPITSTIVELTQEISVTAGMYFTFRCWVYDNTGEGELGLLINWRNGGGSISTTTSSRSLDMGGWQRIDISNKEAPPTSTIARVKVRGYKQEGSGGGYLYLDDALFYDDASLPVMMSSLSATVKEGTIILYWTTESEFECQGFHVLRSTVKNDMYEKITSMLIPCKGNSSVGSEYSYRDENIERGLQYFYKVEVVNLSTPNQVFGPVLAIPEIGVGISESFELFCNYPNPFNPTTSIRYHISSEEGVLQETSLKIFNAFGQQIQTLVDGILPQGVYIVDWNGCDFFGKEVPSGVYFCQLSTQARIVETKKMVKMK